MQIFPVIPLLTTIALVSPAPVSFTYRTATNVIAENRSMENKTFIEKCFINFQVNIS